jgi:hypothetical protein
MVFYFAATIHRLMCTGSFPGIKSGQGVKLTPHSLLVLWSWKGRAIPPLLLQAVRPVQSLSACTRMHFTITFLFNACLTLKINIARSFETAVIVYKPVARNMPQHLNLSGIKLYTLVLVITVGSLGMSRNISNDINCLLTSLCCCIFLFFLEVAADGTYNYQWNLNGYFARLFRK